MDAPGTVPARLNSRLAQWVAAGLISQSQANEIAQWETLPPQPMPSEPLPSHPVLSETLPPQPMPSEPRPVEPRYSVAIEALAYLGGAIIVAALTMVASGYWDRFSELVRVLIPAAGTAVLLVSGALMPQHRGAALSRGRGALWLLSAATMAVTLIVVVDASAVSGESSILIVGAALTAYTVPLWLIHCTPAQHVATFAAAELLAAAVAVRVATNSVGMPVGGALFLLAAAWGLLARSGQLPGAGRWQGRRRGMANEPLAADRWDAGRTQRRWGVRLAAVGAALGATILASQPSLPWLGVVAIAGVVAAATALADPAALAIAAAGSLVALPLVVNHYFASTVSVALVLLATGVVLVGLAVLVARRRAAGTFRPVAPGTPGAGRPASVRGTPRW